MTPRLEALGVLAVVEEIAGTFADEVEQVTRLRRLIEALDTHEAWTGRGVLCLRAYMTRDCRFGHDWTTVGHTFVPFGTTQHKEVQE